MKSGPFFIYAILLVFCFVATASTELPSYFRACESAAVQAFQKKAEDERSAINYLRLNWDEKLKSEGLQFSAELIDREGGVKIWSLQTISSSQQGQPCIAGPIRIVKEAHGLAAR